MKPSAKVWLMADGKPGELAEWARGAGKSTPTGSMKSAAACRQGDPFRESMSTSGTCKLLVTSPIF